MVLISIMPWAGFPGVRLQLVWDEMVYHSSLVVSFSSRAGMMMLCALFRPFVFFLPTRCNQIIFFFAACLATAGRGSGKKVTLRDKIIIHSIDRVYSNSSKIQPEKNVYMRICSNI